MPNSNENETRQTAVRKTYTAADDGAQTTVEVTTVTKAAGERQRTAQTPPSGSGRQQGGQYRQGDKPFQFPWWAVVVGFMIWWPLGLLFLGINAAVKNGKLGFAQEKVRRYMQDYDPARVRDTLPYAPSAPQRQTAPERPAAAPTGQRSAVVRNALLLALPIIGAALLVAAVPGIYNGLYWLPDALAEGGYYWRWIAEDSAGGVFSLLAGCGCLFASHKLRTTRRMRKKIDNIVGDAKYRYIQDIADAIPCSYDKCCKHLENCIDAGVFGPDAYLDLGHKCLVVEGRPPEAKEKKPRKKTEHKPKEQPEKDRYDDLLDQLRAVNDAIPDEEMSAKISRLEEVSAKIFEQVRADPDKLPDIRKFMDYYLPTSVKLLRTYAELEAQGVEGENITESKRRIEQTMDTLVHAFETQLDQMFEDDALDVSADIDVMQNMLRADGLTDDQPFKL